MKIKFRCRCRDRRSRVAIRGWIGADPDELNLVSIRGPDVRIFSEIKCFAGFV